MRWLSVITAALVISLTAAHSAPALPARDSSLSDPLLRSFAYCAGRFSAELEFSWMFAEMDSDRIARERLAMISLLDAVSPLDEGPNVLHLRLVAKFAHSELLTRMRFNTRPEEAAIARQRAEVEIAQCRALILS
ncbi:hypothetical protein [uncultured Celeribacter sp.]|uniref:hypothetical protein n=1 Tax=uncultured Celeribacter sp. TaxID=1303376 RepID=UPI002AA79057|nr:hypothetical protein [uncultured Celeribacter sp.]